MGEQLVDGGDVAVRVAELLGLGDLVGDFGRREWCAAFGAGLSDEADVLMHQPDVEPGLGFGAVLGVIYCTRHAQTGVPRMIRAAVRYMVAMLAIGAGSPRLALVGGGAACGAAAVPGFAILVSRDRGWRGLLPVARATTRSGRSAGRG